MTKSKGGYRLNKYFTVSESEQFAFYKVPKVLFTDEKYKTVSTDAKMLYGLLLDRMYLSVKNGWVDKQGRVYQFFTVKQAQELLHFGHEKICTFHDVTEQTREIAARSGIRNGIAVVYSHHTTCCVITQECAFDQSVTGLETLQQDLVDILDDIIPVCRHENIYLHPGPKALEFAEAHGEDASKLL